MQFLLLFTSLLTSLISETKDFDAAGVLLEKSESILADYNEGKIFVT